MEIPSTTRNGINPRGLTDSSLLLAARSGDDEKAAEAFETYFSMLLVREMRRSLPEGLFGSGPGADAYEAWFDEHLGQSLADRDALGLAGLIKTSIGRAQDRIDGEVKP